MVNVPSFQFLPRAMQSLYAVMLVRLEAHCHLTYMTLQLVTGYELDDFHIYAFGCAFHVPICVVATYHYGSSKKDVYLLSIMILHHTSSLRALARYLFTAYLLVVTLMRQSSRRYGKIRTSTFF